VNNFGHDHEFTKLVIDLKGKDPDDAFSSIPYEKVCSQRRSGQRILLIFPGFPLSLLPRKARWQGDLGQVHSSLFHHVVEEISRLLRI
jgi:hypothetical protein